VAALLRRPVMRNKFRAPKIGAARDELAI